MTRCRFAFSKHASGPAGAPVGAPATCCLCIALFLLLILVEMLTSLVAFAGVFISSGETLISPFCFSSARQHGRRRSCEGFRFGGAEPGFESSVLSTVSVLGLYVPVVLVAFALLSLLLAAYAKDRAALRFSAACQAASCLLVATGVTLFLLLYRSYVSFGGMTLAFYLCAGVAPQLAVTRVLTDESWLRLTSDWD